MNELEKLKAEYNSASDKLFFEFKEKLDELSTDYFNKISYLKDR